MELFIYFHISGSGAMRLVLDYEMWLHNSAVSGHSADKIGNMRIFKKKFFIIFVAPKIEIRLVEGMVQ